MFVAPDAELDDGLLDVVTIGEVGKLRFLANLPEGVQGQARRARRGHACCAAGVVEIEADRPFAVYADGEHLTDLPAPVARAAARARA